MININIYILLWVVLFSEGFFHDAFIMYHPHYKIWKSGTNLATLIGYRWYIVNRMWKRSHENSILIKRESERERERERERETITSFPTWNSSKQMGHSLQSVGTAFSLNLGSSWMSASTASLCEPPKNKKS